DELMRTVPYKMWVSYYLLLLSHQDVHPKTVLDVCCGTGTMCQMLEKEGFKMSGIDLSPGMIEAAVAKARRRKLDIHYEVADASTFSLHRKFDAALSFFDSLNNIVEPEKLQAAFHRVAAHLPPGGSWIFDLNTAYAFSASLFDQQDLRPNAKLQYLWEGDYDPATKIITVNMRFWRDDQEFHEIHRQRAYDEEEIREMLERAGFSTIRVFHSYTLNPPRHKSDRLHFTAIKA
ncbi:MAG TPA: class I SAM-dependent methyltransferase, partial [Fimbriimonas sp.]|nr:class I SAM-dependent methyltransferase [Fimbriimonas sp.]